MVKCVTRGESYLVFTLAELVGDIKGEGDISTLVLSDLSTVQTYSTCLIYCAKMQKYSLSAEGYRQLEVGSVCR